MLLFLDTIVRLIMLRRLVNTVEDLDERMSVRYELLQLGLESVIADVKERDPSKEILAQIEIYEGDVSQDRAEFDDRVQSLPENFSDPKQMFMTLLGHIKPAPHIFAPFASVMKHLLELPIDKVGGMPPILFCASLY